MKPNDAVRLFPPNDDSLSEDAAESATQAHAATAPLHAAGESVQPQTPPPKAKTAKASEAANTFGGGAGGGGGGGLSHNLSSESIKQACDYYDDELSDDDLIEVHNTPECFQKQRLATKGHLNHHHQRSLRKKTGRTLCGESEANPLYTFREDDADDDVTDGRKRLYIGEDGPAAGHNDDDDEDDDEDALNVLNELDAILDIHSTEMPVEHAEEGDAVEETKIEDCLLDLDNYLEEMDAASASLVDSNDLVECFGGHAAETKDRHGLEDVSRRTRTLPANGSYEGPWGSTMYAGGASQKGDLLRGHALRKTISYSVPDNKQKAPSPDPGSTVLDWRRSSMRDLITLNTTNESPKSKNFETTMSSPATSGLGHTMSIEEGLTTEDSLSPPLISSPTCSLTSGGNRILTEENIFRNILEQNESSQSALDERPRQLGRRAEGLPCVLSIRSAEEQPNGCTILSHDPMRPMSAPEQGSSGRSVTVGGGGGGLAADFGVTHSSEHSALFVGSEASSTRSYQNRSPISLTSTDSTSTAPSTNGNGLVTNIEAAGHAGRLTSSLDPENVTNGGAASEAASGAASSSQEWPHTFSRSLALLCCTLGLFNVCRFATLTITHGANFLLQFLLLSVLFGIPMFWLQMCLGAKIKAGPVSMWRISPICKGIGISLIFVQFFVAVYSTASISWILVYIRDSVPAKGSYRWQETYYTNRLTTGGSGNVTDHIADYFNMFVLQRLQFGKDFRFHVSDRLAFNLAIIWSLVFLVLCKGFKSYGKVVFMLGTLPLLGLIVVTARIAYITDPIRLQHAFLSLNLDDFLINSKTWGAAAQEVFLTWVLLGCSVIAVTSRPASKSNTKTGLRRDAIFVVLITFFGLAVAALLGLCSAEILKQNSYRYVPGSFETPESYISIYSLKMPGSSDHLSYPPSWMPHYSSFVGETYVRKGQTTTPHQSGYQALRFIIEILPAVLTLSNSSMSWVWTLIAFLVFALFGFAQLCVMWKPISSALGNSTSSVLLSCVTGLLLSIPFATDMGIAIMHFMDLVMGGSWFIPVLWAAQIFGVFLIRGRPYNGDDLVNDLKMSMSMSAFLALSWNVMLPIGLITLSVVEYKISYSNQFYYWREKSYFPYWARKVAGLTQVSFLILVPVVAIIQIYRYLSRGPPDILDRIEMLYRPSQNPGEQRRRAFANTSGPDSGGSGGNGRSGNAGGGGGDDDVRSLNDDAPPKYTPPPSYTTATGARLAKLLRQSIRRSVRRILGDSSRPRPNIALGSSELTQESLPPDYTSVSTITRTSHSIAESSDEPDNPLQMHMQSSGQAPRVFASNRSLSLGRKALAQKNRRDPSATATITTADLNARPSSASCATFHRTGNTHNSFTADDVVTILRSTRSNRRVGGSGSSDGGRAAAAAASPTSLPEDDTSSEMHVIQPQRNYTFRSIENLVMNAEPVGHSSTVEESYDAEEGQQRNSNNTSVI